MPWFTVIDKIGEWINQNYFSSCCSLYHQSFCLHILNQCHVIFQKQIICDKKHQGMQGCQLSLRKCFLHLRQIVCAYMQTTVILFQTPKLGNITRIIYYKNLNSWELFEIMLTKNLCSYSHNLLQTLENLQWCRLS